MSKRTSSCVRRIANNMQLLRQLDPSLTIKTGQDVDVSIDGGAVTNLYYDFIDAKFLDGLLYYHLAVCREREENKKSKNYIYEKFLLDDGEKKLTSEMRYVADMFALEHDFFNETCSDRHREIARFTDMDNDDMRYDYAGMVHDYLDNLLVVSDSEYRAVQAIACNPLFSASEKKRLLEKFSRKPLINAGVVQMPAPKCKIGVDIGVIKELDSSIGSEAVDLLSGRILAFYLQQVQRSPGDTGKVINELRKQLE